MRVAILTQPLRLNYGGILQAYALQTVLTMMGHEVKVIYTSPYRNISLFLRFYHVIRHIVGKYILCKYDGPLFEDRAYNKRYKRLSMNIQPFIEERIHKYISLNGMTIDKESDFDAIVVGSDQVWRPCYVESLETYFLDFAENWAVKRIAYAASFGVDKWEFTQKQTYRCQHLLKLFNAISVRESSGIELCEKYFCVDALLVLDPTMMLTRKNYIDLIAKKDIDSGSFSMFTYILDENPEKKKLFLYVEQKLKLINKILEGDPYRGHRDNNPSVECWLNSFRSSDFVFTDSFHGCVFSIIFNKPFLVYANKERGIARVLSLLSMYGLQNRMVNSISQIDEALNETIDWKFVNEKRMEMQKISFSFLRNAISC